MSNELIPAGIPPALYQIFTQETPKAEIRTRSGRGGRVLLYTDGAYVIRTLNEAFGWNWDFDADHEEILYYNDRPLEVRCRGRLIVRAGETVITKTQFGSQPIEFLKDGSAPVSLGDAFKGAATDALKKCASLLGIALDLYDSDSEINTTNPQQVQREIQQAKQQKPPVMVEQPKPANGNPQPPANRPAEAPQAPTGNFASPQAVIDAANAAIGQKYYSSPAHGYNALRQELGNKWTWPKPDNVQGWKEAYELLVYHAQTQLAAKTAKEDDNRNAEWWAEQEATK